MMTNLLFRSVVLFALWIAFTDTSGADDKGCVCATECKCVQGSCPGQCPVSFSATTSGQCSQASARRGFHPFAALRERRAARHAGSTVSIPAVSISGCPGGRCPIR
jgi:hypothetical protein